MLERARSIEKVNKQTIAFNLKNVSFLHWWIQRGVGIMGGCNPFPFKNLKKIKTNVNTETAKKIKIKKTNYIIYIFN